MRQASPILGMDKATLVLDSDSLLEGEMVGKIAARL